MTKANWKVFPTGAVTTPATYWMRATNSAGKADSEAITISPTEPTAEQWRMLHFGNADNTGPAADSADPDGDGTTNLDEFIAGTFPKNPSDAFRVTASARSGNGFRVRVPGKFARSYQLVRSADPDSAAAWDPIASEGPTTAEAPLELTDPAPPAGGEFYRVIASMPQP